MRIQYKGVELEFPDGLTTEEINDNLLANEHMLVDQPGYNANWTLDQTAPAGNYVQPDQVPSQDAGSIFEPQNDAERMMAEREGGQEAIAAYRKKKEALLNEGVDESQLRRVMDERRIAEEDSTFADTVEFAAELAMMGIPGGQIRMLSKAPAAMRYLASIGRGASESTVAGILGNVTAGREWDEGIETDAAWGAGGNAVAGAVGRQVFASPSKQQVGRYADEMIKEGDQVANATRRLQDEDDLARYLNKAGREGGVFDMGEDTIRARQLLKERGVDVDAFAKDLPKDVDGKPMSFVNDELTASLNKKTFIDDTVRQRSSSIQDALGKLKAPVTTAARQLDDANVLERLTINVPGGNYLERGMNAVDDFLDVGILSKGREAARKRIEKSIPDSMSANVKRVVDDLGDVSADAIRKTEAEYQKAATKAQDYMRKADPDMDEFATLRKEETNARKAVEDIGLKAEKKSKLDKVMDDIKNGKFDEGTIPAIAEVARDPKAKSLMDDVAAMQSLTKPEKAAELSTTGIATTAGLGYLTGGLSTMAQAGVVGLNATRQRQKKKALKKAHEMVKQMQEGKMTAEEVMATIDKMPSQTKTDVLMSLMVREQETE